MSFPLLCLFVGGKRLTTAPRSESVIGDDRLLMFCSVQNRADMCIPLKCAGGNSVRALLGDMKDLLLSAPVWFGGLFFVSSPPGNLGHDAYSVIYILYKIFHLSVRRWSPHEIIFP